MILDSTNQKQAINEYAKMGSNGFWGGKYLLKCVFVLSFSQKNCNLVVVVGGGGVYGSKKKKDLLYLSFQGHKAA